MSVVVMKQLGVVLILGALATGCVTTKAQTPIERPSLDVPPAPPRVIEPAPVPAEVLQVPEPVEELPPPPVAPSVPRSRSQRDTSRETQKPEPKPETPPVTEPPAAPPPVAAPAPLLRTPATADAAAAERQIRDTIKRAQDGLNKVDFQRLSTDLRNAYNDAKDFISRAEAAIKDSNFELAKGLSSNAEKLAKELQGR
jgi:hypothetical protein